MDKKNDVVLCGTFIHATNTESAVILNDKCIGVKDGKIEFIDDISLVEKNLKQHNMEGTKIIKMTERQFMIPGFIDTHIHAPQYPNAGKGLDKGLLEWLETYTFPVESKFKDLKYAASAYRKAVNRVLCNGTTTACYYATIDTDATLLLCDIINDLGQRALVGKVNMNINSPDYYVEASVEESINETRRYIEAVKSRKYTTIQPIITPRFAIACCKTLMKKLGDLAEEHNLPIQTHLCETKDEVSFVNKLFPDYDSYADVYDKTGLLTEKTVLAHCVHLTQPEIDLIKNRKCGVSHCPNSNLSLRSGLLDARNLLQQDIKMGLGTDVSGGYHPSILDAMRVTLHVSNTQSLLKQNGYTPLNMKEAFSLATLGGAKVLSMEDVLGNFEVGKYFDALLIDPCSEHSVLDIFDDDIANDCFEKFMFTGDDRNISRIFIGGKEVHNPVDVFSVQSTCTINGAGL
ncbi:hypothetical protein ACF0H5_020966 [Mactra antiquata]